VAGGACAANGAAPATAAANSLRVSFMGIL
jgi:hypothetical protein